jgi:hypothetical protein
MSFLYNTFSPVFLYNQNQGTDSKDSHTNNCGKRREISGNIIGFLNKAHERSEEYQCLTEGKNRRDQIPEKHRIVLAGPLPKRERLAIRISLLRQGPPLAEAGHHSQEWS